MVPGALLRAEYGMVPFHGRIQELEDLDLWCRTEMPLRARLFTGAGGMGKTRLALELCLRLREEGWGCGFLASDLRMQPGDVAEVLAAQPDPLLIVVDYAESRRDVLVALVRRLRENKNRPVRLVLLARAALDWWEQLKAAGEGVGDFFSGMATNRVALGPLADGRPGREESYQLAGAAFANALHKDPPGELPNDLEAKHFERALLLHMTALAAIEGKPVKGELNILDFVLDREARFWRERAQLKGIPETTADGIGRAMAAITLGGGVLSESEAVTTIRKLTFFAEENKPILTGIARLLHALYPGQTSHRYIEPILPDLLGEHLVQRELENGADELLDLVLGPRKS